MAGDDEWEDIPSESEWQDVGHPLKEYEEMPWSDVLSKGAGELIPSAVKSVLAVPEAIYNYPETAEGLKQLGKGIYSKAAGALGAEQDPEQKAKEEAVVNAMLEPFTSTAGFKKALAEDPFSVLTTAALPLSGGATGLLKAGETAGKIGTVARTAGKIAKGASYAADPTRALAATAKGAPGLISGAVRKGVSTATGVPEYSFERAAQAGAAADPAIKEAFNSFATGAGDTDKFSSSVRKAVKNIKDREHENWVAKKEELTGAPFRPDIGFDKIEQKIKEARSHIGDPEFGIGTEDAHKALDHIEEMIKKRKSAPAGHSAKSLKGADELKRQLWTYSEAHPEARTPIRMVHSGVKEAISDVAPEYQALMDKWQDIGDTMNNLVKSLGAGDKVASNLELKKFINAQKTPEGRALIERIAQEDPLIPYMVAGSTLHGAGAVGKAGLAEALSAPYHIYNIGRSLLSGNIPEMMGHTATAAGQFIGQSPRAMGAAAYGAGAAGPAIEQAAKVVPSAARPVISGLKRGLKTSLEFGPEERAIAEPLRRAEEETGIREERATGGKVSRGFTVQGLLGAVEVAKKKNQQTTEKILGAPDEHVVHALKIANDHI